MTPSPKRARSCCERASYSISQTIKRGSRRRSSI